jgi:ABC-type transport system substrate-binding protein
MVSQYRTGGSRNYGGFSNPDSDRILDKAIEELNFDARKQMLDEYQQKWLLEWRPNFIVHTDVRKFFVQGNIGGYDTTWGPWFGYGTTTKVCRWFYVEK